MIVEPEKFKVHSLTGRITLKLMMQAFKAVKKNRGAAGLDKVTIQMFEKNLDQNLAALMRDLKSRAYEPIPLRRAYIEKGKYELRPLGIPAVRCRVAQEVVRRLIAPIFEPTFHNDSYGYRKGRNCHMAIVRVLKLARGGYRVVVDADVKAFFDSISHELIMELVAARIADGNILGLIQKFLRSGVMEDGVLKPTKVGVPQGGVISPLLANIVLNHLDWQLHAQGCKFARYADDFVLMCKTMAQAEKALDLIRNILGLDLKLELNLKKTKVVKFSKGFQFLGFDISSYSVRMRSASEEKFKMSIRKLTKRSHNLDAEVVVKLNRVIRGTVNYFHTPFSTTLTQFRNLDAWIRKRIRCMKFKRIWVTDNRRMKNQHIYRLGLLSCRELCLAVKER
ncbi:MAG: group II intron reverse transcriptase/maturase [bacterium]|nr:group II intron reverse transcriptase/maturase [bacterium]